MLKYWSAAALLAGCFLSGSCAARYSAVTMSNTLRFHEEHQLIPESWDHFEGQTLLPYFDKLMAAVKKRGIEVWAVKDLTSHLPFIVGEGAELWGFNTGTGTIYLDSELGIDEGFATLVHELGHSLQPKELDGTDDGQVYAEAFSFIVCKELGLDLTRITFPYFQQPEFKNRHEILLRYSGRLEQQIQELLAEIR